MFISPPPSETKSQSQGSGAGNDGKFLSNTCALGAKRGRGGSSPRSSWLASPGVEPPPHELEEGLSRLHYSQHARSKAEPPSHKWGQGGRRQPTLLDHTDLGLSFQQNAIAGMVRNHWSLAPPGKKALWLGDGGSREHRVLGCSSLDWDLHLAELGGRKGTMRFGLKCHRS